MTLIFIELTRAGFVIELIKTPWASVFTLFATLIAGGSAIDWVWARMNDRRIVFRICHSQHSQGTTPAESRFPPLHRHQTQSQPAPRLPQR